MLSRQMPSANEMMAANPHFPALVKTIEMPKGYIDAMHHHCWHQVIFPIKGLLQTQSGSCQYLVPHTSALFVPAGIPHESVALSNTRFIGIYINPLYCHYDEQQLRTLSLSVFFKELLQEVRRKCQQPENKEQLLHLLAVLQDQIQQEEVISFQLLLPQDKRLKQIFDKLSQTPDLDWSLKQWGEHIGASERTLSRLFAKEFKTSFSLWRQQLRLILSLSLLSEDLSVQLIADRVGYQNDSSYIKAFKAYFKVTPQQFRMQRNHQYQEI